MPELPRTDGTRRLIRLSCITSAWILAALIAEFAWSDTGGAASDMPAPMTDAAAVAFVGRHCIDCHGGDDPESVVNLSEFESAEDVAAAIETWNRIADRVHEGQMPPEESEPPTIEARKSFVDWVRGTIHSAVCDDGISPSGPILRRLNRTEYANTLRDLLGIQVDAGHALPDDGAGGEGFDNASETLFISPIYAEKYIEAAHSALGHALRDPDDRRRILVAEPDGNSSPRDSARMVLQNFLPKVFRRPVTEREVDEYLEVYDAAMQLDQSFGSAIQFTLEAALVSPKFLFLWQEPNESDAPELVSQFEMASRLSYFLWASMPDDQLLQLAEQGKLHDEQVLAGEVARMLRSDTDRRGLRRDSKVRGFASSFIEQWLGTRALGREFAPDESISSDYDSELEGGMKYEPIFFFEDLLADDRSLLNLIDSDFTYVNRRLARHYGVRGEFREQPKRVDLPEDSHRGGVLGMSAVLAVTSFAHRTSPVLRGKWILETLLGTPPPPPPPNVPQLEESGDMRKPTSLRERLELHREDPACASCHASMDPLGFGLENFDVLGRWRDQVDGIAIDASGRLPGGETFDGPEALKDLLLQRKEQFIRNLTSKMLGYALGRGLSHEDACVVDEITQKLAANDYKAQTLVIEIVKSVPFRYKQGQNSKAVVQPAVPPTPEEDPANANP